MFLSRFEVRRRVKAFDVMVEETDRALRHPDVTRMLGALAGELIALNQRLVLPDVHHDALIVPKAERDSPNPLLFPMTKAQAPKLKRLMAPVMEQQVLSWDITHGMQAPRYGVAMDAAAIASQYDVEGDEVITDFAGHNNKSSTVAATYNVSICQGNSRCTASRPVIAVPDVHAQQSPAATPILLGHEELHALDMLAYTPLMFSLDANVAGEFCAYQVSGVIDHVQGGSTLTKTFDAVELFRRSEADPMLPFHPTQPMIDMMLEKGMLHSAHV